MLIQLPYTETGASLYFNVRDAVASIWQPPMSRFATYSSADYASYAIGMTEQGGDRYYLGTFPTLISGTYSVTIYKMLGSVPADGDPVCGVQDVNWTGTAEASTPITPTNAYIGVMDAQAYFDSRLGSDAWDQATADDQLKALVMATKKIDLLRFIGQKAEITQVLEFPRLGQSAVPQCVLEATCELALQLLDDVDSGIEIDNLAVISEGFSTLKTAYNRDSVQPYIRNGIPSSEAWALLLPYLADVSSIKLVRTS